VKYSALAIAPLLLLTFSPVSTANDESKEAARPFLEFGPVRLLAGMPRDRVIASLAESYAISPWKNPEGMDTWGVADKSGNHPLVGYVSFKSGKLLRAGRYWPQSGSGYDVAHTVDHDILAINCGFKGISLDASLSHFQGEPVTGVDVYEEIMYADLGKR
jgi:hypothetical protein